MTLALLQVLAASCGIGWILTLPDIRFADWLMV